MSSLRIGLVAEGPTDFVVIEAALRSILGGDRPFVLNPLQPEGSAAFGTLGTGWVGVYRWCKQATRSGHGRLGDFHLLFATHDLLILHLDADVAGKKYQDGNLTPEANDGFLPCEQACPPASATTDELRKILMSWCNESSTPPKVVVCTPSKSTEAWVVAAILPQDKAVEAGIECFPDPEVRLGLQRKGSASRSRGATTSSAKTSSPSAGRPWSPVRAVFRKPPGFRPRFSRASLNSGTTILKAPSLYAE